MDPDPPLTELALTASSVADDLGYVALGAVAQALTAGEVDNYRVIGGHMVTVLVARWKLGAEFYRETGDIDLGIPPVVVRDERVIGCLTDLGYKKVAGNRFAKPVNDIPISIHAADLDRRALIDVLIPATTSRPRTDRKVGQIVTTEVPGLSTALNRAPVELDLQLTRLNRSIIDVKLRFPDELSALVLKALATGVRSAPSDIVDVWRCLEVALAAGVEPQEFDGRDGVRASRARPKLVRDTERCRDARAHRRATTVSDSRGQPIHAAASSG